MDRELLEVRTVDLAPIRRVQVRAFARASARWTAECGTSRRSASDLKLQGASWTTRPLMT